MISNNCLIIDHDSKSTEDLKHLFREYNPKVVHHKDFNEEFAKRFRFIVLSGGPIHISNKKDLVEEKKFIKETKIPILGICLGHEIIGVTFGSKLKYLDKKRKGKFEFELFNKRGMLEYSHRYYLEDKPKEFDILVKKDKIIDAMQHKTKPILGIQGHPELSGEFGRNIRDIFIEKIVMNKSK